MNGSHDYRENNIAYWTKRAPGYAQVNQKELQTAQRQLWSKALDRRIQQHFGGRARAELRVLDLGCGPGFFAIILAELGYQLTALDYTESMLREALKNAGSLGEKIDFCCMNAEEPSFADKSFDLLVSRNLTWNLLSPERAYAQWVRILAPGGLLLNFDANWYRYLYDTQAKLQHAKDRERVRLSAAFDDTAGTDVAAMEALALQAPLSQCLRPQWDLEVLSNLGMDVKIDTGVAEQLWTQEEWINNASTPMFLISASKAG